MIGAPVRLTDLHYLRFLVLEVVAVVVNGYSPRLVINSACSPSFVGLHMVTLHTTWSTLVIKLELSLVLEGNHWDYTHLVKFYNVRVLCVKGDVKGL